MSDTATATASRLSPEQQADVLRKHESMCWWIARRILRQRHDPFLLEELAAEVRAQFVQAAQTFDPSFGFKFSTYACRLAIFRAAAWLRTHDTGGVRLPDTAVGRCRVEEFRPVRLDALPFGRGDMDPLTAVLVAPKPEPTVELPPDLWDRFAQILTARQFAILSMRHRENLTYDQIGKRIGRCKELVRQTLVHCYDKIRRKLPDLKNHLED